MPTKKRKVYTKNILDYTVLDSALSTITYKESLGSLETSVHCSVAGKKAKTLLGSIKEKQ